MTKPEIIEFSRNVKTPFYVFDYDILRERVKNIINFLPKNSTLCYAIKANPFLIPALKNDNILFEVCSPGELSICKKYNLSPDKIVFSGVCKTLDDIKAAYLYGVKTITLESKIHCSLLIDFINSLDKSLIHTQEVILRLTSGNQFGMCKQDIIDCINILKQIKSIKIRGIHYFTGTQKKINKIKDEIAYINQFCKDLITETSLDFSDIEYGPGFSFNYFSENDENINFDDLIQVSNLLSDSTFNYVIELGRYIASSCGTYVTSVMDVKTNETGNYCIIDGGINHINYYGQMMGMKVPSITQYSKSDSKNMSKYTICGSLCTTADVVIREKQLLDLEVGDILFFNNIGAYSITEGVYLFLSHPLPQVYILDNKSFTCVRNTIESYEINSIQNNGEQLWKNY